MLRSVPCLARVLSVSTTYLPPQLRRVYPPVLVPAVSAASVWRGEGVRRLSSAAAAAHPGRPPSATPAKPKTVEGLEHHLASLAARGDVDGCVGAVAAWTGSAPLSTAALTSVLSAVVYRSRRRHATASTPIVLPHALSSTMPEAASAACPGTLQDVPDWVVAQMAAHDATPRPFTTYLLVAANTYLGRIGEAMAVLRRGMELHPRNGGLTDCAKPCTIVLRALIQQRRVDDVNALMDELEADGGEFDPMAYAVLIKACVRYHEPRLGLRFLSAAQTSAGMADTELDPEVLEAAMVAATALGDEAAIDTVVDIYRHRPECVTTNASNALALFHLQTKPPLQALEATRDALGEATPPPDVATFVQLMDAHVKNGQLRKVGELFVKMEEAGVRPNVPAFTVLIKAHALQGNLDKCDITLTAMRASGFVPSVTVVNSMLSAYLFHGKPARALTILSNHMREDGVVPDRVTTKLFAMALAEGGHLDEATELVRRERHLLSINERRHCTSVVINLCAKILDPEGARAGTAKWRSADATPVPRCWLDAAPARDDPWIKDWLPDNGGRVVYTGPDAAPSKRRAAVVMQKAGRALMDAGGTLNGYHRQLLTQRGLWKGRRR